MEAYKKYFLWYGPVGFDIHLGLQKVFYGSVIFSLCDRHIL